MAPRRAPCRCRALEPEPAPRSSLHACLLAFILHVCVHDSVYQRNNIVRSAYHTDQQEDVRKEIRSSRDPKDNVEDG